MSTTIQPGALARLFELYDKTPAVLTADDWAAARLELSRYSTALRTIAQMWDGEAANVAREAIAGGEAAAFERELLDLARRKLVQFHDGRVTLTPEGYLAVTRLFGRA